MKYLSKSIKVSVIIPVYNVELYVEQAVRSIMNQSLKEIEIIIVNDGSSDNSYNIVKELATEDYRIRLISNPNQGQSVARNLGIYKAAGEYIYFFDSDDILESDALEVCYNRCSQKNLDFVFFDADTFCNEDLTGMPASFDYRRACKYGDEVYTGIDILQQMLMTEGYTASPCLSFINRNFLSENHICFYPYILHEDELFTFFLYIRANRVAPLNRILFHRRFRASSIMTSSYSQKNVVGHITVCRELHSYSMRYNISSKVKSLVKLRISILISTLLVSSQEKLSELEYREIKKLVYYEFRRYISWRLWLKTQTPILYSGLQNLKRIVEKVRG